MLRERAAASSMASGSPSNRRQISATAATFPASSSNCGMTDSARGVSAQLVPEGSPARFADAALTLVRPSITNGV